MGGLAETIQTETVETWEDGDDVPLDELNPMCACGCAQRVKTPGATWLNGHASRKRGGFGKGQAKRDEARELAENDASRDFAPRLGEKCEAEGCDSPPIGDDPYCSITCCQSSIGFSWLDEKDAAAA